MAKVQLRQISFHLSELYLVNDICSREKGEKSDILSECITYTMIDENRSVKSIYKSQDRDVSFILEILIGKKRREVSFGFNEHESIKGDREREKDASSCVYFASRSMPIFFVLYCLSKENLLNESICI